MDLRDLALMKAMAKGSSEGGGGSGGSTIDEIMQANGYTTESPLTEVETDALIRLVTDAVYEAFRNFDGQYGTGYSWNNEVVPYFNDAEYKIAFVIQ